MNLTFSIVPINNGTGVTLTNLVTDPLIEGHSLKLNITGRLNESISTLTLNAEQAAAYVAKTPIEISASVLTASVYEILPDDFYEVQLLDILGSNTIKVSSPSVCMATYSYIQNAIHDQIVHTDRIVGMRQKTLLHELVIHLRGLEILGNNPAISMKDAVVARINYLKTL